MSITTDRPELAITGAPPARGDRLVVGALFATTLVLIVYQLIARALIPPLALFAALFAICCALVWRRSTRWSLVVAGVLVLLYLGGSVRFFVANLAHPASPVSFLAEAFLLLSLVTVLIGVIAGLRGAGPGYRTPVAIGACGLAGLATIVSVVAALSIDSDARQPDDVAIEVVRSGFPEDVEVPDGTPALWVDNQDPFHHTLVIDGAHVRAVLPGSTAVRIPVDLAAGTYRYWCDVPGHESMEGELRVR